MRELDALLVAFVGSSAHSLTETEMAVFEGILELPDPVLHSYLLGRSAPEDSNTAELIERIRAGGDSRG
jgi:succinate dehydrogenase flavin-adding protein (antitoxin of CptAB toxin-antitoxin module)